MNSFTYETNTLLEQQRQQLENTLRQGPCEIVHRPARPPFWARAAQALLHWLTNHDEPRIKHRVTGNTEVWRVYDPVNRRRRAFKTEDEVRVWLEQRHYQ
jgi:hypothetical protein